MGMKIKPVNSTLIANQSRPKKIGKGCAVFAVAIDWTMTVAARASTTPVVPRLLASRSARLTTEAVNPPTSRRMTPSLNHWFSWSGVIWGVVSS